MQTRQGQSKKRITVETLTSFPRPSLPSLDSNKAEAVEAVVVVFLNANIDS